MSDEKYNPAGTKGFSFIEFGTSDPEKLRKLFAQMRFIPVATHKTKQVELWKQGEINFLLNTQPDSFALEFVAAHGPCACGMGFLVEDAKKAYAHVKSKGGRPFDQRAGDWYNAETIPVIYGIGDNMLYLVDHDIFADDFNWDEAKRAEAERLENTLDYIDHVTHNVFRGNMNKWAKFYEDLFNFRGIRYFDIEGKLTGLFSRAMTSPCGKIRIPINESADDKSQIEEYLKDYKGEGIQHIALGTNSIYETIETLRDRSVRFLDTPDTYYRNVDKRLPEHGEPLERMQKNKILIDGAPTKDGGILLQIFTETVIGPIFFEIIQRKGDEGFGEGNFQALFDSIEQDQIERGVL